MLPYIFRRGFITRGEGNTLYVVVNKIDGFYNRVAITGIESPVISATLVETGEPIRFNPFYDQARDMIMQRFIRVRALRSLRTLRSLMVFQQKLCQTT